MSALFIIDRWLASWHSHSRNFLKQFILCLFKFIFFERTKFERTILIYFTKLPEMLTALSNTKHWLGQINFFSTGSQNRQSILIQRWSSWIYIILFTTVILFLLVYTALGKKSTMVTTTVHSYAMFESLLERYPKTLKCPCSVMSIPMSKFIQIEPRYHQVLNFYSICC